MYPKISGQYFSDASYEFRLCVVRKECFTDKMQGTGGLRIDPVNTNDGNAKRIGPPKLDP